MDIDSGLVEICRAEFLERIASLHSKIHQPNSYSDMKIRLSDGTELFCHRNIVCGQCAFFEKALEPGRFKESFTGVVELPADPPRAIETLIEFLYKMYYVTPPELAVADQALFHLDVYRVADIYQLLRLRRRADEALCWLIKNHWTEIIPVIPELSRELRRRDKEDSYGTAASLKLLFKTSLRNPCTLRADDDTWTGLHKEAPEFMNGITDKMEDWWFYSYNPQAGRWLDRLGGEHAVGMVIGSVKCPGCGVVQVKVFGTVRDEFYHCSAGRNCKFRAAGNVWSAALES